MSDIKTDEAEVTEVPVVEDALSAEDLDTVAGGNMHADISHSHPDILKH